MPETVVRVGPDAYLTNDRGEVFVVRPEGDVPIRAESSGFTEVAMPSRDDDDPYIIQMQPSLLNGIVRDVRTGAPVPNAEVALIGNGEGEIATSRTDGRGAFIFKIVPGDAMIRVEAPGYDEAELAVESRARVDIELSPMVEHERDMATPESATPSPEMSE
ncbi:MAG TPA: carboxypeptidase-like regulatory domain-containing protein [Thermomicrobiales bacterium]|nr:carboxypeptidase-like regulatory domain-containing protein [Thermomicrobiales bacterium]